MFSYAGNVKRDGRVYRKGKNGCSKSTAEDSLSSVNLTRIIGQKRKEKGIDFIIELFDFGQTLILMNRRL